nr:cytochrome P450 [Terrimesophilobacter mesophilus]
MAASVGILVDHLARHPDLQESLRNSPEELTAAIDEILRIHSPLVSNRRVTTRPVELGGRRIDAGERITIFWASANRDEAVFGDPDAYRPEVNAPHNVLYGRGIHACPGAGLARLELRVALSALLAGTRRMELVPGPPDYAAYPASGFHTLLLRITR